VATHPAADAATSEAARLVPLKAPAMLDPLRLATTWILAVKVTYCVVGATS